MSAAASTALYNLRQLRDAELSEAATAATEVLRMAQVHRPRARYPSTEPGDPDALGVIVGGVRPVQPTMHQVPRTFTHHHNPSSAASIVQGTARANATAASSFRPIGREGNDRTISTTCHGATFDNNEGSSLARPAAGTSPPMPVAGPNDEQYLGTIQCFVRKQLVEYFAADSSQLAKKGRQTAICEGRIGVRCVFCKDLPKNERASQSCSFPNALSGVRSAVSMVQHRHLIKCHSVPNQIKLHLETLKNTKSSQKQVIQNRNEYWVRTAEEQGLYDTPHGIRSAPSETALSSAATRGGEGTPRLITPTEPILAHFSSQASSSETTSAEAIYGNLPPPPPLPPIQTLSSLTLEQQSSTKKRIQHAQDDLYWKTSKRAKSDLDDSIDWGQFEWE